MKEKYEIKHWQDDVYAVYKKVDSNEQQIFTGTLETMCAWITLKEKGYDF